PVNDHSAGDPHQVIACAGQLRLYVANCKTSPSHHGRQSSESESEPQATATGESQKRDAEERATGLSRQGGPEKEVDDAAKQQLTSVQCEPTEPTEGPTDFPRIRRL